MIRLGTTNIDGATYKGGLGRGHFFKLKPTDDPAAFADPMRPPSNGLESRSIVHTVIRYGLGCSNEYPMLTQFPKFDFCTAISTVLTPSCRILRRWDISFCVLRIRLKVFRPDSPGVNL